MNMTRRTALLGAAFASALPALVASPARATGKLEAVPAKVDLSTLPRRKVALVDPPFVHAHDQIAKRGPEIVEFEMTIVEKTIVLDEEGTTFPAMTFNGTVPGPLMVVHQDDYVELTLINPDTNTMPHNIDFHSATGALGGGELTLINPGEKVKLRFRATRAGTFVYHCAPGGPMIPWHVVSGMNGAIMILPRDGLKDDRGQPVTYDKIFYVGEQDFYVPRDEAGNYKSYESAGDSYEDVMKVMNGLIPTHVVFNGAKGALTGDNAMKSKVGETVLIVHSQANRDTRPHLIGGHGDLETWFIRGGSAGAALYTFLQPGLYAYVNHNLIEGVNLGASAHFQVEGDWDNDLMEQTMEPTPIS